MLTPETSHPRPYAFTPILNPPTKSTLQTRKTQGTPNTDSIIHNSIQNKAISQVATAREASADATNANDPKYKVP